MITTKQTISLIILISSIIIISLIHPLTRMMDGMSSYFYEYGMWFSILMNILSIVSIFSFAYLVVSFDFEKRVEV